MACCGQRRTALINPSSVGARPSVPSSVAPAGATRSAVTTALVAAPINPPPLPMGSSVMLRYLERSRILVRGPVTGRQYEFSATNAIRPVAYADAEALVRTRFFRRA
jgi:hypothetical protein